MVTEAVAGFAHLYAYGVSKVTFLSTFTERTIHNLKEVDCPAPDAFNHKHRCALPSHKFPKFPCATKTPHSLFDWLLYYLETKIMYNAHQILHVIHPLLLLHYTVDVHIYTIRDLF